MEEVKSGMSTEEFVENLEVFNNSGEHINNPKVGDYIRTIDGYIRRIAKVNTERKAITYSGTYILDKPYKNSKSVARNKIKKFNQDIFDLVKAGDYVNGYKVKYVCNEEPCSSGKYIDVDCELDSSESYFFENQIKSICTKEQFAAAEYRLED